MNEYQVMLEDLQEQKEQLERERGFQVSETDLLAFITDLLKGDPADKVYQRKIIDNLVYKVFVDDDHITTLLHLGSAQDVEEIRLADVDKVVQGIFDVQTQLLPLRQKIPKTCLEVSGFFNPSFFIKKPGIFW